MSTVDVEFMDWAVQGSDARSGLMSSPIDVRDLVHLFELASVNDRLWVNTVQAVVEAANEEMTVRALWATVTPSLLCLSFHMVSYCFYFHNDFSII